MPTPGGTTPAGLLRVSAMLALLLPVLVAPAHAGGRGAGDEDPLADWIARLRCAPAAEDAGPDAASAPDAEERDALIARVVAEPRDAWMAWVEELGRPASSSHDHELAVRILGAGGRGRDLARIARVASLEERGGLLARDFAALLEGVVTDLLAREPEACFKLRNALLDSPPSVRRSLAAALAGLGGPLAVDQLAALLGFDEALDPTLLVDLARAGRRLEEPAGPAIEIQVRRAMDRDEPQVLAAGAEALGVVGSLDSIDLLVDLLDHPAACVRGRAHRSLQRLAGIELPALRSRWVAWLAEERDWYERAAPALLDDLDSPSRIRLVDALEAIGMHRLHRAELAREVERVLERPSASERVLACRTLEQLGAPRAAPALVPLLEDDDDAVRLAAVAALRTLTGHDLPPQPEAWAAVVKPLDAARR